MITKHSGLVATHMVIDETRLMFDEAHTDARHLSLDNKMKTKTMSTSIHSRKKKKEISEK